MCGIFGYLGTTANNPPDDEVLSHRGPDQFDTYSVQLNGNHLLFSHNRLSIIGPGEQGRQPFVSDDGQVVLTYNGEIYNYRELRADLRDEHECVFDTETDTEVLLEAYQTWGLEETLERINGIFAFGIADLTTEQIYVVRDHLGTKPVYYTDNEDCIAFSSEVKGLFAGTDLSARLRHDLVGEYLANFWVQEPDTLFEGVYKLESGHYLTVDATDGTLTKSQYWDVLDAEADPDLDGLGADIEEVVSDQMVSDVPVGLYVSGGIDSSIVAYHAADVEDDITALNLNNSTDRDQDEHSNLAELRDRLGIDLDVFSPSTDMLDIYREMIYHMDEPIADPAIIPAHLLARAANERDIRVMLSGMGGDEIFAGYRRMQVISNLDRLRTIGPAVRLLSSVYPSTGSRLSRNLRRISNFLKDPSPSNYFSLAYYFSQEEVSSLVGDQEWFRQYDSKIRSLLEDKEFVDDAQRYQYLDMKGYLSSHNLMYIDKASMAASVEVRVPLLDRRLTKYFNLPTSVKTDKGPKTPLKNYLRDLLGESFLGHRKQGFAFPVDELMHTDELRKELDAMRSDDRLGTVLDLDEVAALLDEYYDGREDHGMKIWAIYTFWLWLDEFDVAV